MNRVSVLSGPYLVIFGVDVAIVVENLVLLKA